MRAKKWCPGDEKVRPGGDTSSPAASSARIAWAERRASPTDGGLYRSWRSQQAHGAPLETAAEFWELSGGPAQRLAQIVHNRPLSSGGERRQPHPLRHLRDAQRRHIDEAADVVDLAELRDNEELAADL